MQNTATQAADEKRPVFDVWPAAVPGERGDIAAEKAEAGQGPRPVLRISNVSQPTITLFQAPADRRNGTAVLVCPGGGYNILAWDLEGEEVAQWLNSIGVTAVVLKYRVPRRKDLPAHQAPLQDAQRAMSLVRNRASEWGIDPQKIGILGFSAGGHLSAATSTNSDRRSYSAIDAVDQVSCRPDFTVLIYPAYLQDNDQLSAEIRVSAETPPAFLAHAGDDRIGPENSIAYYLALKRAGVPAELHVFNTGGHGFGLRPSEHPVSQWPERCRQWMVVRGLLPKPAAE